MLPLYRISFFFWFGKLRWQDATWCAASRCRHQTEHEEFVLDHPELPLIQPIEALLSGPTGRCSRCPELINRPWCHLFSRCSLAPRKSGSSKPQSCGINIQPTIRREAPINPFLVGSYAGTTPTGEAPPVHISMHEFPTLGDWNPLLHPFNLGEHCK